MRRQSATRLPYEQRQTGVLETIVSLPSRATLNNYRANCG
jgi:hypothetical protein